MNPSPTSPAQPRTASEGAGIRASLLQVAELTRPLLRLGMRRTLAISIALLVGTVAVFVAVFFPARLERQALRSTVRKADAVQAMAAHSVRAALVFADTVGIREVLLAAHQDSDMVHAQVTDQHGRLVAEAGDALFEHSMASTGLSDDGLWYISVRAVVRQDTVIGRVAMMFSLASLRRDVALARQTGVIFGFMILVFGILSGSTVAYVVTRPLKDIVRTVRCIRAGNLHARAEVPADPQLGELAQAFNAMLDRVADAQRELAEVNTDLEQRVRDRTETLRLFLEVTPQPIIAIDNDRRVTLWNRAAETLFGWSATEVIGEPIPYVPAEEQGGFASVLGALQAGQPVSGAEVVRMKKDGTRVPLLISATSTRDANGNTVGAAAVLTDLTDRKALEAQLAQSQKMEAVGRLAGGVAHDFNNVLTVITATSALLLESQLPAQQRQDVEEIERAALRAAGLTRQLLAFSRARAVQLSPVRVSDVVRDLEPMLRRVLRENVRLRVEPAATRPVRGDVTELEQILMNLVVNASDAMPKGGVLTVRTEETVLTPEYAREHPGVAPGDYVMLSVADTGGGMTPDVLNRIFEPFFTTKPIGQGTGLGLATTYAIVRRMEGSIDVRSKVGAGSTFRIFIPRITEESTSSVAPPAGAFTPAAAGGERILLVEDEPAVRVAIHRGLERLGYKVRDAGSAEAALAIMREPDATFDVVVTDVMMPGMNGWELAEALAATDPGLRVIFMSGYTDDTIGDGALVDDTRTFLHKPVTAADVARAMREFVPVPLGHGV